MFGDEVAGEGHNSSWFSLGTMDWAEAKPWERRLRQDLAGQRLCQNEDVTREEVISTLRKHAGELKAAGVMSASLFGSLARGESDPRDVDIAVRLDKAFSTGGFDYFWQRERLMEHLSKLLGSKVDLVEEPVHKPRLQQEIDRDRAVAF